MAEGQTTFKEEFDDQLTCSVCLDQYTNPKTLPCLHSFCLKCIQRVPVELKDGKHYIDCPTCRESNTIPEGGLVNLPNDFKINKLLELRKKLVTTQNIPINDTKCLEHNDLLTVYCETCFEVICRDCTISQQHKEHKWFLISECYSEHHQQIQNNLDQLKQKITELNTAVTHLDIAEKEVLHQGEDLKEQINTYAQQLIQQIQTSQTQLSEQVDTIVQKKTQLLSKQKQQAQKLHSQLDACQHMIEHSLKEWTKQKILANKLTMMDEMNTVSQHVAFQPIEKADVQFKKIDTFPKEIGHITSTTYGKATLKTFSTFFTGKASKATLKLESGDGSPSSLPASAVSATLFSPGTKRSIICDIIEDLWSMLGDPPTRNFEIKFTPPTKAENQLIVRVGGVDIPDSPLTLPIKLHPQMRKPVNTIEIGLNRPCGIAMYDNGDIVVAEYGAHCITILNKEGTKVKSFGTEGTKNGQFTNPCGIAISIDGHILVTDDHRLQKLTTDGDYIDSVGNSISGSGQYQFSSPKGLTVHPKTGNIYVADSVNNRIQVFTNDLKLVNTIYSIGLFRYFSRPTDIVYDDGCLYIAEKGNQCVTKITTEGSNMDRFYCPKKCTAREIPNKDVVPCAFLTINSKLVYTSGIGAKHVVVFTLNGSYISSFPINSAGGIAMDHSDNLYTANFHNGTITVF